MRVRVRVRMRIMIIMIFMKDDGDDDDDDEDKEGDEEDEGKDKMENEDENEDDDDDDDDDDDGGDGDDDDDDANDDDAADDEHDDDTESSGLRLLYVRQGTAFLGHAMAGIAGDTSGGRPPDDSRQRLRWTDSCFVAGIRQRKPTSMPRFAALLASPSCTMLCATPGRRTPTLSQS